MKLFNYELEAFTTFLYDLKLVDRQSRMRTRLTHLLAEKIKQFESEYNLLLEAYVEKDADGEFVQVELEEGKTGYQLTDPAAFQRATQELGEEAAIIEENEERMPMLLVVRDAVLNCGLAFEGAEAVQYERWCTVLEAIQAPSPAADV
ncbi:DUF1617 family protein [Paenibacillaceae bacterium]|nr:DUF1617 family protein [Paenibacillaceae bacterium]